MTIIIVQRTLNDNQNLTDKFKYRQIQSSTEKRKLRTDQNKIKSGQNDHLINITTNFDSAPHLFTLTILNTTKLDKLIRQQQPLDTTPHACHTILPHP